VQNPGETDIWVLRARTLTVHDPKLPEGKSVRVVADPADFAALLRGRFNLTLSDAELSALWMKAAEQHEQKTAETAAAKQDSASASAR
jgi:N-hydroxyarylamine O-acetyltransferase